jgi:formiminotetrahydrofolate cyclodeaminase
MLKELSLEAFSAALASDQAVPGGGCVAALAASLAAALAAMVARLTLNKARCAPVAGPMARLRDTAEGLRMDLLAAVDQDAQSYQAVLAAYRLPKESVVEKAARSLAIQKAFTQAARVPLEVAEKALQVMTLAADAVARGNPDMVTDAAVGALMARSAALGALYNVKINLKSINDADLVNDFSVRVQTLERQTLELERQILATLRL